MLLPSHRKALALARQRVGTLGCRRVLTNAPSPAPGLPKRQNRSSDPSATASAITRAALFEHRAGGRFTQVSYRGGAPAMADLVSGWLDLIFTPVVDAIQQVRSRQVRVLGITRAQRSAQLPDVPAVGEALPGYAVTSWLGPFAPAGTPASAVARIAREVAAALRAGPTRERMEQLGYEPVGSTPEEFPAFFAAELPRVAELVRISGATVD